MKRILFIVFALITSFAQAQVPQGINYQAVARDASDNLYVNQPISVRFTIGNTAGIDPLISGTYNYQEIHPNVTTSAIGLFNLKIGGGTPTGTSTFGANDWQSSQQYLLVEIDFTGGTNYAPIGSVVPFQSVPYALLAQDVVNKELPPGGSIGEVLSIDGGGNYSWVSTVGTDDQDIDNLTFNTSSNILTVGIENGVSQTVDLSALMGTDSQDIDNLAFNPTTNILTVGIESGTSQTVNLTSLLELPTGGNAGEVLSTDGSGNYSWVSTVGTDDQNINDLGIIGNLLTVGIENGNSQSVPLTTNAPATTAGEVMTWDGTSWVAQTPTVFSETITSLGFNSSDTTITYIDENGASTNINLKIDDADADPINELITSFVFTPTNNNLTISEGTNSWPVDLSSLNNSDADWYKVTTTTPPSLITDAIYTQGKVGIGTPITLTPPEKLTLQDGNIHIQRYDSQDLKLSFDADNNGINWALGVEDSNDGDFKIASTNNLASSTRMTILSSGNVGIGTSTPSTMLEVAGKTTTNQLVVEDNGLSTTNYVLANSGNGYAVWANPDTLGSGGGSWSLGGNNAGPNDFLGTTNPQPLSIKVNNYEKLRLETNGVLSVLNTSNSVFIGEDVAIAHTTQGNNTAVGCFALQDLLSGNNNSALGLFALKNNTNGSANVAIGVQALQANTTGDSTVAVGYKSGLANTLGANNTFIGSLANAGGANSASLTNATAIGANAIVSQDNSLVLGNGANVGIGTSTPNKLGDLRALTISSSETYSGNKTVALELQGSANSGSFEYAKIRFIHASNTVESARISVKSSASNVTYGQLAFSTLDAGGVNERMIIKENGNVGIGTSTPIEKLEVVGNIIASGTIIPSDIRYKKDISTLESALENVLKLRGVHYEMKEEYKDKGFGNGTQVGVIAQEVEKVYPELVVTHSDGFKGVDYSKFTPILIEAIKEQQEMILELKKEIEELKKNK